jgi:hypothetical protein
MTIFIEESCFYRADSRSADEEVPLLAWILKGQYRVLQESASECVSEQGVVGNFLI